MPNRYIRDGFVDSERVTALTDWTHRVYSNLLVKVDDAGRHDARVQILRSSLFPLGTTRRDEDFTRALKELQDGKLIILYEWEGRPLLQVTKVQKYGKSQTSRYPWRDGSHRIEYVTRETRDGLVAFVSTSLPELLDGVRTPSPPHTDGVPTNPTYTHTDTDTCTDTHTQTGGSACEPSSDRGKTKAGAAGDEIRSFAQQWISQHCPQHQRQIRSFVELIQRVGRDRAVTEVQNVLARGDPSIANPFAYAKPLAESPPAEAYIAHKDGSPGNGRKVGKQVQFMNT